MKKINTFILAVFAVSFFTVGVSEARPRRVSPVPPPVGVYYENLGTYRSEKLGTDKTFYLNHGATTARVVIVDKVVIIKNAYAQLRSGELVVLGGLVGRYSKGSVLTAPLPTYRGVGIDALILETTSPLNGSRGSFRVEIGYSAIRPGPVPRPAPPYPYPPRPLPPPVGYCDIEFSSSSYYVNLNGVRNSPFLASFDAALRELRSMERSRTCTQSYSPLECRVEYSGSSYYVTRGGVRYSTFLSSLDYVLRLQDNFTNNGVCTTPIVWERCSVDFTGSSYYVKRGLTRMSSFYASHRSAGDILDKLVSSGNCTY